MPPEAEENGTHAQGREVNCSLQRMRCSTNQRTRTNFVVAGGRLRNTGGGEEKKKVRFSLFGNKIDHSEIRILIYISKIITKNSGGLAAMESPA